MIILENTKEYKDTKLTFPVGIGVVQTEAVKNFYNTSDADATSADILIDKTAYGKYGKLTGTLDLENEKEISYQEGVEAGIEEQKSKLESITITENGSYSREDGYNEVIVDVPDLTGDYNEGVEAGIEEQKSKLESITITENGSYSREDGYNEVIVDVPDLNGDYNEGVEAGIEIGKAEVIEGMNDANITASDVTLGKIGYGANNEKIVGTLDLENEKEISYQDGYETGKTDGYDSGYSIGYEGGYNAGNSEGYQDGYAEGLDDGITDGRNQIIEEQSDANITASDVTLGKIGYGANNEKIVGTLDLDAEKEISYQDGYAEGLDDGITDGRNQIIEEQSDANITASDVTLGKIGYGANNEKIVGTLEAITSIDVGASGIKFGRSSFSEVPSYYDFSNVTSMQQMFYTCSNLTSVPQFDTSNVTDMSSMFYSCSNLTSVPQFDTSNVTNMTSMFYSCSNLTFVPQFDTSNVTNMTSMFNSCSNLTSVPQFDTSNVTDMGYMFSGCSNLTSVPQFDTSNVTNMNSVFGGCSRLTSVPQLNCQSLTSLPAASFTAPFNNCPNLESFGGFIDLGKTFTGSLSKTFYMGTNNQALTHESMINTFNGLYDLTTTSYTGTATFWVSRYPYDNLTEDDIAIATSKGWVISRYNG